MGIALLGLSDLFIPLQTLASRWMPSPGRRRRASALRYVVVRPAGRSAPPQRPARPAPPLRVVRVVDPQSPDAGGARLVISGRMADVCAELDRLAAREDAAALH